MAASKTASNPYGSIVAPTEVVKRARGRKAQPLDQGLVDFLAEFTPEVNAKEGDLSLAAGFTVKEDDRTKTATIVKRHIIAAHGEDHGTRLNWSPVDEDGMTFPQVYFPAARG